MHHRIVMSMQNGVIKQSAIAGNGVFATVALTPGDVVFAQHRPLVAVLDQGLLEDICSNCFNYEPPSLKPGTAYTSPDVPAIAGQIRACSGCKILRYCSTVGL